MFPVYTGIKHWFPFCLIFWFESIIFKIYWTCFKDILFYFPRPRSRTFCNLFDLFLRIFSWFWADLTHLPTLHWCLTCLIYSISLRFFYRPIYLKQRFHLWNPFHPYPRYPLLFSVRFCWKFRAIGAVSAWNLTKTAYLLLNNRNWKTICL